MMTAGQLVKRVSHDKTFCIVATVQPKAVGTKRRGRRGSHAEDAESYEDGKYESEG